MGTLNNLIDILNLQPDISILRVCRRTKTVIQIISDKCGVCIIATMRRIYYFGDNKSLFYKYTLACENKAHENKSRFQMPHCSSCYSFPCRKASLQHPTLDNVVTYPIARLHAMHIIVQRDVAVK